MNNSPLKDITGIILAGGKSLRYGRDKAFEPFDGVPLIKRVINAMEEVFEEVIIIANEPDKYSCLKHEVYEDVVKGIGPIAGILTGIMHIKNEAGFFVACDMPFLIPAFIRHIANIRNGFDIVIQRVGKNIEPLHAVYTKDCLPFIKRSIWQRRFSIRSFFPQVSVRYVEEDEIRRYDPELSFLVNINKPEDIRRIRGRCLNL